ncbi:MAG: 50S ribosomal protein L21e [Nanoarchaeota archaeon]|nr:50S ribosomal protein L21e [Nanoarchaeota archaeon]MBU1103217.1 50S ribosomal protein L21e [Nanoarchaeota archaeon]
MLKRKKPRQKGKFSFTRYFQKFQPGDSVAVVKELSFEFAYSNRLQGKTGKIIDKRGSAYQIEMKDLNKTKRYLIRPIHLKKIENVGGNVK